MFNACRMPDVTPGPLGSHSVDAIDLSLVELLRGNARLSYAELARQVGLSAPAVHERVGKLESSGVIRAYRAEVEPEAIGLAVTALISIVEDSGGDTDDVLEAFRRMPEIESCYFMAGVESFLLKARVGTIAELEQLIVRLNRTPGVASTRTGIALSTKWENRPQAATPPAA
ncbi:transcriptional regulator, AsnC family [Micromonospora peucetia]|uniref:Transcriptional regulator, AsnC family n=1 Tax=Micromonospora peucetia TaxID=47871 RepID=A0A1C6URH3_9ACTN|nr:transcriptional regulator, AsnC family [Micromonospora peucetia]